MLRKLNTKELEKVSGGEIFKVIPKIAKGTMAEKFFIQNTDSEGKWHPCVAPEVIRKYFSIRYDVIDNYNQLMGTFYTLKNAERYAQLMGINTDVIETYEIVDF